jgi:hypothetical protein
MIRCMATRYAKNAGAVYSLKYHLVWCPKYRRPVLTDEAVEASRLQSRLLHNDGYQCPGIPSGSGDGIRPGRLPSHRGEGIAEHIASGEKIFSKLRAPASAVIDSLSVGRPTPGSSEPAKVVSLPGFTGDAVQRATIAVEDVVRKKSGLSLSTGRI